MSVYTEQVSAAIVATTFRSPSRILWFGAPAIAGPARRIRAALSPGLERECVLAGLQALLYQNFYCKGQAMPASPEMDRPAAPADLSPFVQRLSEANSGVGYIEAGWTLQRVEDDELVVRRDGLDLRARRDECQLAPDAALGPGLPVSLRFPKEFRQLQPGFYIATGDTASSSAAAPPLVRLYWNLSPDGSVCLMRSVSRRLNEASVPFQLKVLTYLGYPRRCDATVLYLSRADYGRVARILEQVHVEVCSHLSPAVPALTKCLAPGVGLAEDPGGGASFGDHRCRLLADALLRAQAAGKRSQRDRSEAVREHFAQQGIDLEKAPYLNPGSDDVYGAWPWRESSRRRVPSTAPPDGLAMALGIARRICDDAIWSGGRCNWMGYKVDPTGSLTYRALSPDLYSGTSGVAIFLADVHGATGDRDARATALGAMRQALSRAEDVPPPMRLGLFAGWTGLALAAALVGLRIGDEALVARAGHLVRSVAASPEPLRQLDVISGAAGAITAWLTLQHMLPGVALLDACARMGDELIARAVKTPEHWSWPNPDAPGEMSLTGFSHGAAGIGVGLLDLFRASGDARYRAAATEAFRYERRWFDARAGNWPDFRGVPARRSLRRGPFWCAAVWCHGAPGIALSRLRAYEITGEPCWKTEALTALRTTHDVTKRALESNEMGFSLCHGFAGNAEILQAGTRLLGGEFPGGSALADDVARVGIERYGDDHAWPGGAGGPTPSLMVGRAGIGHFYLRLHDPAISSILCLTPSASGVTR